MIFTVKKALYKERVDFCITPVGGKFKIFISPIKGGYYLFNEWKEHIGQLIFNPFGAELSAPDTTTLVLSRTADGFEVKNKCFSPEDRSEVIASDKLRNKPAAYFFQGDCKSYNYTVYEKVKKIAEVAARVIPDVTDESSYRFRIEGGSNVLKIIMIIIAIDRIVQEETDNK